MRPLTNFLSSRARAACASLAFFGVIQGAPSLCAEPIKGEGSFSLYYVAEVTPVKSGGIGGKVETVEGKWETYRLSVADTKKANMEGSVSVKGPDGKPVLVSISKIGVWADLPKGWEGKGNRVNPLVAYRTVAADQKAHPYGSRVFVPDIAGFKTPDGKELDGYFWVADVGGGIKGARRFDIFVGAKPNYTALMAHGPGKWKTPVEVDNLPSAPAEFSPRTDSGVKRILEGLGYDIGGQVAGDFATERKGEPLSQKECLTDFQKQHPQIPGAEYGSRRGAVTLWFLTQAGIALKKGEAYPVTPFGK